MATVDLVRSPDVDDGFRREISEALGYHYGGQYIPDKLLAICRPFTRGSVESYKAELVRRNTSFPWDAVNIAVLLVAIVGAIAAIVYCFICGWSPWLLGGCVATLAVCMAVGAALEHGLIALREPYWRPGFLNGFDKPLPDFALQTALDVKRAFPGASFMVDELVVEHRECVDPFLVAKIDGSHYYLEVWNEPSYKQERVI